MVTLITVNYNSTKYLNKLLNSVSRNINKYISEIIVVDNNSKDFCIFNPKPISLNTKLVLIKNDKNIGFSKAVNQAINKSKNNLLVLVNPDCQFIDDSIKNSLKLFKSNPHIGVIGGKLIGGKNIQYSATTKPNFFTLIFEFTVLKKVFKNNCFSKHFWVESTNTLKTPIPVYSVCGAYMVLKKDVPKLLFDEKYFLYLEDLDYGEIVEKAGYKTYFNPNCIVKHVGGISSNNEKYNIVHKFWYDSRDYYASKHFKGILGLILQSIFNLEKKLLIFFKIGDLHNTVNQK